MKFQFPHLFRNKKRRLIPSQNEMFKTLLAPEMMLFRLPVICSAVIAYLERLFKLKI